MKSNKSTIFVIFLYLVAIIVTGFYSFSFTNTDYIETTNAYKIVNYDVVADVNEDNVIAMTENITVYFNQGYFSHGIYRYLPIISSVGQVDESGNTFYENYRYSYEDVKFNTNGIIYNQNNNLVLKIGNSDAIVDGKTITYKITYKIDLGADRDSNKDAFYFNMIGNGWNSIIENAKITVNLPKQTSNVPIIYFGEYGSIKTSKDYEFDGKKLVYYHQNLNVGEGVTVKIDLEEGYFARTYFSLWNVINICAIVIILMLSIILFFKFSNKTILTPVVNFNAPSGLTSADIGYIIDKKVNNKDIASLIIYWANKGYLNIDEEQDETYLIKCKEFDNKGKLYESILFNKIFEKNNRVHISKLSGELSESIVPIVSSIEVENKECFNNKAYMMREIVCILMSFVFTSALFYIAYNSVNLIFMPLSFVGGLLSYLILNRFCLNFDDVINKKSKIILILFISLLIAFMVFFFIFAYDIFFDNYGCLFICLICYFIVCFIIGKFNVRTDLGMKHLGDIIGLKNFIEVAEKERIKMLLKDNPKLFYDVLPYAYVLGIYEDWCKKFEGLTITKPDWISNSNENNILIFNLFLFNTMNNFSTTLKIANSIRVQSSFNKFGSSSNGSGGGFSGGGHGGGGGGSW